VGYGNAGSGKALGTRMLIYGIRALSYTSELEPYPSSQIAKYVIFIASKNFCMQYQKFHQFQVYLK
jgi:hypothetical protein